jgi:hypothetical protein
MKLNYFTVKKGFIYPNVKNDYQIDVNYLKRNADESMFVHLSKKYWFTDAMLKELIEYSKHIHPEVDYSNTYKFVIDFKNNRKESAAEVLRILSNKNT